MLLGYDWVGGMGRESEEGWPELQTSSTLHMAARGFYRKFLLKAFKTRWTGLAPWEFESLFQVALHLLFQQQIRGPARPHHQLRSFRPGWGGCDPGHGAKQLRRPWFGTWGLGFRV